MRTVNFSFQFPGKQQSTILVDLVESKREAAYGLSGRPINRGMLFPGYGRKTVYISGNRMWQSVLVLFGDKNGKVIESRTLVPGSMIKYNGEPVEWILELPIK